MHSDQSFLPFVQVLHVLLHVGDLSIVGLEYLVQSQGDVLVESHLLFQAHHLLLLRSFEELLLALLVASDGLLQVG